jgi:hypothetical protein
MSLVADTTLVNIDDSIALPNGIAAAFNRSRSVFLGSDAFVDRIFAANSLVNEVNSWRWAGVISSEQCSFLLRKVRRDVESNPGVVFSQEGNSAEEVIAREAESEQWKREFAEEEKARMTS